MEQEGHRPEPDVVGHMHCIVAELEVAVELVWLSRDLLESRLKRCRLSWGAGRMESQRMWWEVLGGCRKWIVGGGLTAVRAERMIVVGTVVVVESWFVLGLASCLMRCEVLGPFVGSLAAVHVAGLDPQRKRAPGYCELGTVAVDEAVHFVADKHRHSHVEPGLVGHTHMIVRAVSLKILGVPRNHAEL